MAAILSHSSTWTHTSDEDFETASTHNVAHNVQQSSRGAHHSLVVTTKDSQKTKSRIPFYLRSRPRQRRPQQKIYICYMSDDESSRAPPPSSIALSDQLDQEDNATTPRAISPSDASTHAQRPRNYPTPPGSDDIVTHLDPQIRDHQGMSLTKADYYPASAYGPHGPPGFSLQASHDTVARARSGYFHPNGDTSDPSIGIPHGTGEQHISQRQQGRREPPPVFSHPPVPVYHNQPQSVASYYPAPHHQAQLLARANANATSRPILVQEVPSPPVDPILHASPQEPDTTPPGPQSFLQGGIIYTPSVEELGLHSLSDGPPGEKPPYPYPTIIRCAILGSPRQRLTLSEIYLAMENRYPWFKTAGQGWKNSVRHNLSLNKCFAKISRPITEPGKGAYWTVDLEAGEGNKRPRKRNKKPKKTGQTVSAEPDDEEDEVMEVEPDPEEGEITEDSERRFTPEATANGKDSDYEAIQGYSYPPPARPSGMVAPAPQRLSKSGHQDDSVIIGRHSREPEGLVTAAALGGKVRRTPINPIGPVGEGRHRGDIDSD